jgi:hypothetical protein
MRALGAAAVVLLNALAPSPPAQAAPVPAERISIEWRLADPDDFRPGLLISDDTFYNSDAMDAAAIQRFLEERACIPEDGVPCLDDFTADTPDVPDAGAGHCAAHEGGPEDTAAEIIADVAAACGINPQVLLVLLQKEQSLLTRPTAGGYERAAGYACPDDADCDTTYFGFFNQVYNAAWQFRQYTLFPDGRAHTVGSVDVAYSPDAACGTAPVEIRNQATANLYNYTPYQPNEAALAELYGGGDDCSAYGNRNFWRIFTDWFGDPTEIRFPEWLGSCVVHEAGRACVDDYWVEPPVR